MKQIKLFLQTMISVEIVTVDNYVSADGAFNIDHQ